MNILFIIKFNIFVLIKWSYSFHPTMLTIEPRMVVIFQACSPISFKRMSLWYPFLEAHLTTYHSTIGVLIRNVFELGLSSLHI